MMGINGEGDTATYCKCACDVTFDGVERRHQIIENPVGDMFMEYTFVAIRPQIQFERFRLHNFLIRHITDSDGGEVRLPCHRADAGEFWTLQRDRILPSRMLVGEGLKDFTWMVNRLSQ